MKSHQRPTQPDLRTEGGSRILSYPAGMVLQRNGFLAKISVCALRQLFHPWLSWRRFSSVLWRGGCSMVCIPCSFVPTVSCFSPWAAPWAGDTKETALHLGLFRLPLIKFEAFLLCSNNSELWSFWIKLTYSRLNQRHALSSAYFVFSVCGDPFLSSPLLCGLLSNSVAGCLYTCLCPPQQAYSLKRKDDKFYSPPCM